MNRGLPIHVFFNPDMAGFAARVVTELNGAVDVHDIRRDTFPDKTPNIKLLGMERVQREPCHVVYFSQYTSIGEKKQEEMIIFVLADTYNVHRLTVVDMFDPLATMERIGHGEEGTIATANVDAHWWNTLPRLCSGESVRRILYDHHTLQNRFYFRGNTSVIFRSGVDALLRQFPNTKPSSSIAFPDEGAQKRFGSMFAGHNQIVCGKQRDGDKRVVRIIDGDAADADVLIVDDLVRSGGTLIQCLKALKKAGARSVSMFVTHAQFPNESWCKFEQLDDLSAFYTTNTIPRVTSVLPASKFIVISLAGEIAQLLQ